MTSSELSKLLIPKPFAKDGTITPIVAVSEDMPNFSTGFPENFSAPHSGDGRYLARAMMNAIGNIATINEYFRQAGGIYQFDAAWVAANGGYPKGAVLDFLDGNKLYKVLSLVDNNTVDYTSVGVDGTNWLYCNVDQEVKYSEICDVPNFTWQGETEYDSTAALFNGETFPIGYARFSRNGLIGFTGTIDFTSSLTEKEADPEALTRKHTGGFGIVACKKENNKYPNPWNGTTEGALIYQRGCLETYSWNNKSYSIDDLTTLAVTAGDEYVFYILNFGGNVANSTMKIVLM